MKFEEKITIGPFGIFFTNINREMNLPGHSHYAEVTLSYRTLGTTGFPAFEETYATIQAMLKDLTVKPFRDHTNEAIARDLFAAFAGEDFTSESWKEKYKGEYQLAELSLSVRGVPDRIGHADGFTTYTVTAK
jgi:hypothetical protein